MRENIHKATGSLFKTNLNYNMFETIATIMSPGDHSQAIYQFFTADTQKNPVSVSIHSAFSQWPPR